MSAFFPHRFDSRESICNKNNNNNDDDDDDGKNGKKKENQIENRDEKHENGNLHFFCFVLFLLSIFFRI